MPSIHRRAFLRLGVSATALAAMAPRTVVRALAEVAPCGAGRLTDVDHVVIFIQENRSFDHYFGAYRGVRGFADHPAGGLGAFSQEYRGNTSRPPIGRLLPFHLDTATTNAACVNDITHEWGPQHQSWNGGRMDGFVNAHVAADGNAAGTMTMGYYTRADLAYYYALADAFTICDAYHCSIFGPTYPNRLYSMSATVDPAGSAGGPVVTNPGAGPGDLTGLYSWTTMPERLQAAGVSWKVYSQLGTNNNVLSLFRQYMGDKTSPLFRNALLPTFPGDFQADVAAGTLPQVSWVVTPMAMDEHPPAPAEHGEFWTNVILQTLLANPAVWSKTVMFLTYDENGGFFDHVPPPVAPAGTPGEYLTVASLPPEAAGIRGPIGLGFRVPMLVISPFSRGGRVCSDVFDHTSLLRFVETRFGVEVPNLSSWRRATVGDLSSTLTLGLPDTSAPSLPTPSLADPVVLRECTPAEAEGEVASAPSYALPDTQAMPAQEPGGALRVGAAACPTVGAATVPRRPTATGLANTGSATGTGGVALASAVVAAAALMERLSKARDDR